MTSWKALLKQDLKIICHRIKYNKLRTLIDSIGFAMAPKQGIGWFICTLFCFFCTIVNTFVGYLIIKDRRTISLQSEPKKLYTLYPDNANMALALLVGRTTRWDVYLAAIRPPNCKEFGFICVVPWDRHYADLAKSASLHIESIPKSLKLHTTNTPKRALLVEEMVS